MDSLALVLILGAVFCWAVISARFMIISTPIFFVAVGLLLAEGIQLLDVQPDPHATKLLAEVTLVWVLFADASRVRVSSLRHDTARYVRLLAVGLPLTIAFGSVAASTILDVSPWYALLVGAALAPTDAALGAAVMTDQRVPYRLRQTLNVESGLNDGIATPVVTTALAAILVTSGLDTDFALGRAVLGLPLGVVLGLVAGAAGGTALRIAHRRGWGSEEIAGPAVLALALLTFVLATMVLANGYVAAFVAGIAFGSTAGRGGESEVYYVEQTCGLASMLCWLLFGAVAVPTIAADWSWPILLYAVLSITVIRMLSVALAFVGARASMRLVLFTGWFGPRGLASVVFALIAAEDLHDIPGPVAEVIATIGLTVLLSVVLHGLTAQPLIRWFTAGQPASAPPTEATAEVTVRHLVKPSRQSE
ncbi:cation:proton antiporter [Microlunatus ginsengisoli]|uniref:Cation:proton antiporter n=1 Tax=Microlunatus ginsengisoli TaxID=363863 RepID=A0ABP7AHT6_9ACTN